MSKAVSASGAVYKCEAFQVIAYNKNGTQSRLFAAATLAGLLKGYSKVIERMNAHPATVEVMKSYTKIFVWSSDTNENILDLPYFA